MMMFRNLFQVMFLLVGRMSSFRGKKTWMLPLIISVFLQGYGQTPSVPEVKPLTPNAAALFKVLERPIGTFTGTVPVDFPLCGVGSGDLSTTLSLSYNGTGGIRVEEAASSVGLGFSFNDGGGRITQIVNSIGDDWQNGLIGSPTTPANFDCYDMNGDVYNTLFPYTLDLEPDIFMYSFNGQSGKFFFTNDGKIIMMQKTGIKVEYTFSSGTHYIKDWTITDEQGNKYFFSGKQENDYTYYDNATYHTTYGASSISWYLQSVTDQRQENTLAFTYQVYGEVFTTYSAGRIVLPPTLGCDLFDLDTHDNVVQTDGSEKIVSSISGRSGFLLIYSSTGRQDGFGRKVDSIRLFTTDSVLLKRYKFRYDYFGTLSNNKRLKLLSFSEWGGAGSVDSLNYVFDYESGELPARLSASVDSWGFYNGTYNSSMFPNYVFKNGSAEYRRTDLGNKNANPNSAKVCMLKKITYPLGGYREFVYEGNTALVSFNPNLYHPDASNSIGRSFYHTESEFNNNYGSSPFFIKYFTVNSTDGGANFKYTMTVPYSCGVQVKLYKTTTANQSTGGTLIYNMFTDNYPTNILNGYYRIEFYRTDVACWVSNISGSWTECLLSLGTVTTPHYPYASFNENIQTVGGLRIKEIRDYDPVTGKINKTEYKYKIYSGDSSLTSGLLILPPQYIAAQQPPGVECYVNAVLSSSNYPLASQGGSYVVYPEVRTIESDNGWTDRIYSYVPDAISSFTFPYTPPVDNSAYRGDLLQEKVYNKDGTLLKKTTTSYNYGGINQPVQGGLKVRAYWAPSFAIGCGHWSEQACEVDGMSPQAAFCHSYYLQGKAKDLSQVIDSTFTPWGTLVQKTQYLYDTLMYGRMFLRKIKRLQSNGDLKVSTFNYPFNSNTDFVFGLTSSEQTIKTALKNINYLLPIESVDSFYLSGGGSSLIGGSKFIFSNSGSDYYLSKARTYTTLTDFTEVNLSGYDTKWNLTEKYKTNDAKEVYLWGYNYSYPVAKVVGSSYPIVLDYVNNSVLQSPTSDVALRNELNNLRTGLASTNAQVTTYTYIKGVGISSVTDPSGRILYYLYDAFGRLHAIKDQQGNVLKKICYNYQGQSGDCSPVAMAGIDYKVMYGTISSAMTFTFTNTVTGAVYSRTTTPNALSGILNGGTIPAGTYNLQINNPNGGYRVYYVGCSGYIAGVGVLTMYNVYIDPACATLTFY